METKARNGFREKVTNEAGRNIMVGRNYYCWQWTSSEVAIDSTLTGECCNTANTTNCWLKRRSKDCSVDGAVAKCKNHTQISIPCWREGELAEIIKRAWIGDF